MYRRKKKSTTTKKVIRPKLHLVDGVSYKSKSLATLHTEWKSNKLIKNFELPNVSEAKKKSKYGALKAMVNDRIFDSVMEAKFYVHLLQLQHKKDIKSFECQVTYELQEKFKDTFTGKTIRPITYIADFVVHMNDGGVTVIDVKGQETPEFKIKKKMFQHKYPNTLFMCVQWVATTGEWTDLEEIKASRRKKKKLKKVS